MIWLLTWPAYGTWLPGPARGWVDRGEALDRPVLPEPDASVTAARQPALTWPVVRLDEPCRTAVLDDLQRVATLRDFTPYAAAVATDHVHVLLACAIDRDLERLVQLVKGALSRKLSMVTGDPPARGPGLTRLRHHKWWARQYSLRNLRRPEIMDEVQAILRRHPGSTAVWGDDKASDPGESAP